MTRALLFDGAGEIELLTCITSVWPLLVLRFARFVGLGRLAHGGGDGDVGERWRWRSR